MDLIFKSWIGDTRRKIKRERTTKKITIVFNSAPISYTRRLAIKVFAMKLLAFYRPYANYKSTEKLNLYENFLTNIFSLIKTYLTTDIH